MPSFPGRKRRTGPAHRAGTPMANAMGENPGKVSPSKGGSTAGRRQYFRNMGSSEAGRPGTKTELRQAKHRVADVSGIDRCRSSKAGERCTRKAQHDGWHWNNPSGQKWQTKR